MHRLIKVLLSFAIFLELSCSSTNAIKRSAFINPSKLASEVEKTIHSVDKSINIGILITSLENEEIIFEKNADRHFTPASTIKLFTLAAALFRLGPFFRFETKIFTDAILDNGRIKNLYIKGSGDPSLKDSDLIDLASELKQMGIVEIDGNIFVDNTIFDDNPWPEGVMWDDRSEGFGAPTTGLNLNRNRILIKTIPQKLGANALAILYPKTDFFKLKNKVKTVASSKNTISWSNKNDATLNQGLSIHDSVEINGEIGANAKHHYIKVAVKDPSLLAGHYLKEQLIKEKINIKGEVIKKAAPKNGKILTSHISRPLSEALIDFMKISENIGIESLIKTMAALEDKDTPGSFFKGLELVKKFLKDEVGIEEKSVMSDAAGLSRYNLVTPRQMVKLLKYVDKNFMLAPEFMTALSIGGEDGFLKSRMKNDILRRKVRAKTGSMTGISSTAGFLYSESGRFAFAIMINGIVGSSSKYIKMQDDILTSIFKKQDVELAKTP